LAYKYGKTLKKEHKKSIFTYFICYLQMKALSLHGISLKGIIGSVPFGDQPASSEQFIF